MKQNSNPDRPKSPGRRAALRRLAGFVTAAYVVPEVVLLSDARAGGTAPTPASTTSGSSTASSPSSSTSTTSSPSSPSPSAGSSSTESSPSRAPGDSCQISGPSGANTMSISRSDLRRAQEAIEAGYAQPLENIWRNFTGNYNGRVIGIEFTGAKQNPLYRFRAISRAGRLETVTISAQTGDILRIVGC